MTRRTLAALLLALAIVRPGAAQPVNGWRGNGTGLWPDAAPPLVWQRTPRGVLHGVRSRADRPGEKAGADDAAPLAKGLVREWLVLGPFAVADSVQDFGKSQLPD